MNSMFLLGAGASIDAGLADAYSLTERIYAQLCLSHDKAPSKIFGLVLSKLISRKVRNGGSPFDRINVEEVYDGIRRLSSKNSDILSDFVTGWDPAINLLTNPIRERDVEDAFQSLLNSLQRDTWGGRGRLKVGMGGVRQISDILRGLGNQSDSGDTSILERSLLQALVDSLQHDIKRISYVKEFIGLVKKYNGDITTLNYDLIAESAINEVGFSYDYGLSDWNSKKLVRFKRSSQTNIRILKLHGSLNWFASDDDIEIRSQKGKMYDLPNLVFGGSSDKLRIDGPYLQLRHEFQSRLLDCNILVIVGYSFNDEHLNSIIRRWTGTRRAAKLIVVNPSHTGSFAGDIGFPYARTDDGQTRSLTVDLNHIRKGASAAMKDLANLLETPLEMKREERNGFLPHVHFRIVE